MAPPAPGPESRRPQARVHKPPSTRLGDARRSGRLGEPSGPGAGQGAACVGKPCRHLGLGGPRIAGGPLPARPFWSGGSPRRSLWVNIKDLWYNATPRDTIEILAVGSILLDLGPACMTAGGPAVRDSIEGGLAGILTLNQTSKNAAGVFCQRRFAIKVGCGGLQTTRIIDLAGALVGSNPGHDLYHFVLRFRLSFRYPGKWSRRHAISKIAVAHKGDKNCTCCLLISGSGVRIPLRLPIFSISYDGIAA